MDCTGSMGSYIASATRNIEQIMQNIIDSGKLATPEAFRVGLIAYRDHPPQDSSYVVQSYSFSSEPAVIKANLSKQYASGGPFSLTPAPSSH